MIPKELSKITITIAIKIMTMTIRLEIIVIMMKRMYLKVNRQKQVSKIQLYIQETLVLIIIRIISRKTVQKTIYLNNQQQ